MYKWPRSLTEKSGISLYVRSMIVAKRARPTIGIDDTEPNHSGCGTLNKFPIEWYIVTLQKITGPSTLNQTSQSGSSIGRYMLDAT
jgi:hypothetical protein